MTAMRSASARISSRSSLITQHRGARTDRLRASVDARRPPRRRRGPRSAGAPRSASAPRRDRARAGQRATEDQLLHVAARTARRRGDSSPRRRARRTRSTMRRACSCARPRRTMPQRAKRAAAHSARARAFSQIVRSPIAPTPWRSCGMRATPASIQARGRAGSARPRDLERAGVEREHARTTVRPAPAGRCRTRRRSRRPRRRAPRGSAPLEQHALARCARTHGRSAQTTARRCARRDARRVPTGSTARPTISLGKARLVGRGGAHLSDQLARRAAPRTRSDTAAPRRACG